MCSAQGGKGGSFLSLSPYSDPAHNFNNTFPLMEPQLPNWLSLSITSAFVLRPQRLWHSESCPQSGSTCCSVALSLELCFMCAFQISQTWSQPQCHLLFFSSHFRGNSRVIPNLHYTLVWIGHVDDSVWLHRICKHRMISPTQLQLHKKGKLPSLSSFNHR